MAIQVGDHTDFTLKELQNAVLHGLTVDPGPTTAQVWFRTDLGRFSYYDGTAVRRVPVFLNQLLAATGSVDFGSQQAINVADPSAAQHAATKAYVDARRLDQAVAPTGPVSFNGQRATSVGTPSAGTDAANKTYVDGVAQGIAWKQPARVASTANVSISSAPAAIDGVTLVAGDRVLLKNQTAGAENGLRVYTATGAALARAGDADSAGELMGAAVFVSEGTQQNTLWTQTVDAITLDTTALAFVQIASLAELIAGAGLTKTGNTVDVVAGDGSITVSADSITVGLVPISKGGTGQTSAENVRSAFKLPSVYTTTVAGGAVRTITHSLALDTSWSAMVTVVNTSTGAQVMVGVVFTTVNALTVDLSNLPGGTTYGVVVVGKAWLTAG